MVKTLMGKNGLFHYLSNPFTENNYNSLKNICQTKTTFKKCIRFREGQLENQRLLFLLSFQQFPGMEVRP